MLVTTAESHGTPARACDASMVDETSTTTCEHPLAARRANQDARTAGRSIRAGTGSAESASRQPRSESTPTRWPASDRTAAASQAVVVLPLVPVTAITVIDRAGSPASA